LISESGFTGTLDILGQLNESRQLFISLKPPFVATLEIGYDVLEQALQARPELTPNEFRASSREVGEMILAILADTKDSLRDVLVEEEGDDKLAKDAEFDERMKRVERALVDDDLRARYELKVTSKAPAFTSIDWDVKEKTFDARKGAVRFPYATIRLRWQREFEAAFETYFNRELFDSAQINFTKGEIAYVIDELKRVLAHLDGPEAQGGH
jgi:hypothetical protein